MQRTFTQWILALSGLLVAAAMAAPLQAALIFEDDFETGTLAGNGWTTTGGAITLGSGAQSAFGPLGDAQGVRINDTNTGTTTEMYRNFAIPSQYSDYQLRISFDFKYTSSLNNAAFRLTDGVSLNGLKLHLASGPGATGNLAYRNSSTFVNLNSMQQEMWYHFDLVVEPAGDAPDSFSLRVRSFDGLFDALYSNLTFQSELTSFSRISFYSNSVPSQTGTNFVIDNVQLLMVVPEPSSLALAGLAGLGGAALVLRRKQRRSRAA